MRLLKLYSENKALKAKVEQLKQEITHLKIVPKHILAKDAGLDFAMRDLDEIAYFRCPAQLAMPLERWGRVLDNLKWQSGSISGSELKYVLHQMSIENENAIKGIPKSNINVGVLIKELEMRSELCMHTELLYEFVALHLIREDEPMEIYSESIQQEKVKAFKKMVAKGGSYPFFQLPELNRASEILKLSEADWIIYWDESIKEQERLRKTIRYLREKSASVFSAAKSTSATS